MGPKVPTKDVWATVVKLPAPPRRGAQGRFGRVVPMRRLRNRRRTAVAPESVAASDMTCSAVRAKGVYVLPFLDLLIALVNGPTQG